MARSGVAVPTWSQLSLGLRPPQVVASRDEQADYLGDFLHGWQRFASSPSEHTALEQLLQEVDEPSRALLLSQGGTCAARVFTVTPSLQEFRVPNPHFRTLLLRRLRLPLSLSSRICSCRRFLDPFGDHRAACSTSGVLGARGAPLERVLARICREAGARVGWNVFLRDLNLDAPVADARRIEVVANGLPLWHGVQLAVDTTLVSPVRRDGTARLHAAVRPGVALQAASRRKRVRTYPEVVRAQRCRLVVFGLEVGGRWSAEAFYFLRKLARSRARDAPRQLRAAATHAFLHR